MTLRHVELVAPAGQPAGGVLVDLGVGDGHGGGGRLDGLGQQFGGESGRRRCDLLGVLSRWGRVHLTGLATVHVRQQEIEQACRAAGEAWRIATRTRTALSLQQVHDVRRQLERWQDSRAVRELDELLRLGG